MGCLSMRWALVEAIQNLLRAQLTSCAAACCGQIAARWSTRHRAKTHPVSNVRNLEHEVLQSMRWGLCCRAALCCDQCWQHSALIQGRALLHAMHCIRPPASNLLAACTMAGDFVMGCRKWGAAVLHSQPDSIPGTCYLRGTDTCPLHAADMPQNPSAAGNAS